MKENEIVQSIKQTHNGLPWEGAGAGGTRFEGGAVHFPRIHIHIFAVILVFFKDNCTALNCTAGSVRQTQSFRRKERSYSGPKGFYGLGNLPVATRGTDLDKWKGAKAFSQGTSMSKGPEARPKRKE